MLQEGWDVLNLFDIVRLYDTRDGITDNQGNYVAGKGTVSEAQLIGRGARYYPFPYQNGDKYRRKFDDNESEKLRVLEQMHYHCKHNPKYISELRQALVESGIMSGDDFVEISLKKKQTFIDGRHKKFQKKQVYVNQIDIDNIEVSKSELQEQKIVLLPDFSQDEILEVRFSSGFSQSQSLLGESGTSSSQVTVSEGKILCELVPTNVMRHALNSNKNFTFDKLKKAYPKLKSMSQFMEKLGEKPIRVIGKIAANRNVFSTDDQIFICTKVLICLDSKIKEDRKQVIVGY